MVPQGLLGGTLIWTPTQTLWVVSLPSPSFYSPPPFYEKPIWLGWGAITHIHSCMHPDSMTHF